MKKIKNSLFFVIMLSPLSPMKKIKNSLFFVIMLSPLSLMKKIRHSLFFLIVLSSLLPVSFTIAQNKIDDLTRRNKYQIDDLISYSDMKYITSVAVGRSYIYFGSTNGILRKDRFFNEWDYPYTTSNGLADNGISVVAFDWSTDYIWAAHSAGISYYNDGMRWWRNISKSQLGMNQTETPVSIGIGQEEVWIETDGGFYKGNKMGSYFQKSSQPQQTNNPSNEIIWFGRRAQKKHNLPLFFTDAGYLFFQEGYIRDKHFNNYNLSYNIEDDRENLWIGTWGLGAGIANLRTNFLDIFKFGLYQNSVEAIEDDDGVVWIGGQSRNELNHGITLWDRRNDTWDHINIQREITFHNYTITSIKADSHYVWLATLDGLVRYDKRRKSWKLYNVFNNLRDNLIYKLDMDGDGLWVATRSGVNLISGPKRIVYNFPNEKLRNSSVYDIKCDGYHVWAGTSRGIFRYDKYIRDWELMEDSPEIVIPTTTAIGKWENEMWFGTGGGIQVFDKESNEWRGFPQFHYFEDTKINCIIPTEEIVWIGTENGLYKYNKEKNYWVVYTDADGLIDDAVRTMVLEGDYLWLGTKKGLTFFRWNRPGRID